MSTCKDGVIALIGEVLEFECRVRKCFCEGEDGEVRECSDCKTIRALQEARVCIIQGSDELDLLKVRFIGVQEAIIAKLKEILKPGENGGYPND